MENHNCGETILHLPAGSSATFISGESRRLSDSYQHTLDLFVVHVQNGRRCLVLAQ